MEKDIKKEVEEASKAALASKEVPLKELYADVYLKNFEPKLRGPVEYNMDHLNIGKPFIPFK